MESFLRGDFATVPTDFRTVLLALLLAFLLGQIIAWVYKLTRSDAAAPSSFTDSLILMPTLVALLMIVLSNNLITAFGVLAVFAMVRFRNNLRDTLDTTYVLTAIVLGMACGTQKFSTAIVGCLVIAGLKVYLWYTSPGTQRSGYDVVVKVQWSRLPAELAPLRTLLDRHAVKAEDVKTRLHPELQEADVSYRLLLRNPDGVDNLLRDLSSLPGVSRVTSIKADGPNGGTPE